MQENVLIGLTIIAVAGVGAQWLAWRFRLPSILLLLLFGFIAGPISGFLDPDEMFGQILFPLVSVAVALILYEGGLTLRFRELSQAGVVVRNLVSVGAAVTLVIVTIAARYILGLDLVLALLLGAILVVTGPTVIQPLLRHIRPTGPVGSVLKWEGIVIDPIGALLAVLIYEAVSAGSASHVTAVVVYAVGKTIVVAGGLGLAAAALLVLMLYRHWLPDFLENAVSLMFVVAAFAVSNMVQHESGLFAVTVMGIALANQRFVDVKHIVEFKENLRILLISALFIVLAARLDLNQLTGIGWRGVWFVVVLILLVRPLSVLASTAGSKLNLRERAFLAWMAPRGIVAAAVASVFALQFEKGGHEAAGLLVPITFISIIGTVLVYGLTSPAVARLLKLADPRPQGVLIVGSHSWGRAIAKTLHEKGIRVLVVDTNHTETGVARMAGLKTYTGSILGERTLDELDLGGIGRLLALTHNDWVNVLAVQQFRRIFGAVECYQIPPAEEPPGRKSVHKHLHGRWVFGPDVRFDTMERRVMGGEVVKATKLSEEFDFGAFCERYGPHALPLFLIRGAGKLIVASDDQSLDPQSGDTLVALVRDEENGKRKAEEKRENK